MHVPSVHASPTAQAWPQDPQLAGSVCVVVQVPPHDDQPTGHAQPDATHWATPPSTEGSHAFPHAPQSCPSWVVSTHEPLQLVNPVAHAVEHWPPTHVAA